MQIQDFLQAVPEDREPLVAGRDGRRTVEIFTAIYRSQRDREPIKSPMKPELDQHDLDHRLLERQS